MSDIHLEYFFWNLSSPYKECGGQFGFWNKYVFFSKENNFGSVGPKNTKVFAPTALDIWNGPESFTTDNLEYFKIIPLSLKDIFPHKLITLSLLFSTLSKSSFPPITKILKLVFSKIFFDNSF